MPLAAVTGRAELMDAPHPGGLGGTYSGNPLACVAAIEAIDTIREPAFLARADGRRANGSAATSRPSRPSTPTSWATCGAWGRCWSWSW